MNKKTIKVNSFHGHYDKSGKVHPNYILKVDQNKKMVLSASFTHSKSKAIKIPDSIDKSDESVCYVRKKLVEDKFYNYTSKEYNDLILSKDNKKIIMKLLEEHNKKS